jgi:hypothetical protein
MLAVGDGNGCSRGHGEALGVGSSGGGRDAASRRD